MSSPVAVITQRELDSFVHIRNRGSPCACRAPFLDALFATPTGPKRSSVIVSEIFQLPSLRDCRHAFRSPFRQNGLSHQETNLSNDARDVPSVSELGFQALQYMNLSAHGLLHQSFIPELRAAFQVTKSSRHHRMCVELTVRNGLS